MALPFRKGCVKCQISPVNPEDSAPKLQVPTGVSVAGVETVGRGISGGDDRDVCLGCTDRRQKRERQYPKENSCHSFPQPAAQ